MGYGIDYLNPFNSMIYLWNMVTFRSKLLNYQSVFIFGAQIRGV